MTEHEWLEFEAALNDKIADVDIFMDGVFKFFGAHPSVHSAGVSVIHSMKKRLKDRGHIREKIIRKRQEGREIRPDNIFTEITDLAGVRLLLLFQSDFSVIDSSIRRKISGGDWVLAERGRAYTWDPEATAYFEGFNLDVIKRESSYTSVHYLLKPRVDADIVCEVQVRTLFEEIWGEIDHRINYPIQTDNLACKEQLMVLSKIVGAGSRLVDSIQRTLAIKSN